MLTGYTYDNQLFISEAFRKFQNTFVNGKSGVIDGMGVTVTNNSASIANGYALIKGGLLREQGGTTLEFSANGYYIVVLEIDLSRENTTTEFNQGSFKLLYSASDYPTPLHENLTDGGNVYQMELARFQKTDQGVGNLSTANRETLKWTSLYQMVTDTLEALEDLSSVITTTGGKTINGDLTITGDLNADLKGNADTATNANTANTATKANKLSTARTIALTGDVVGSGTFDGSGNLSIATVSPNHITYGTSTPSTLANGHIYIQYFN